MLKFSSCGKKHAVPNDVKTDSHIILKRILQFPARPSHFLGTMENTIFADLTKISKYLKSDFLYYRQILLKLPKGPKAGTVLCSSRSILVDLRRKKVPKR